jgi:hypothetical protein
LSPKKYERAKNAFAILQFADYFGIANLRAAAAQNLTETFEDLLMSRESAGEVLAMILSTIRDTDPLRATLFELITLNREHSLEDDLLLSAIQKHEPMAWVVLNSIKTYSSSR